MIQLVVLLLASALLMFPCQAHGGKSAEALFQQGGVRLSKGEYNRAIDDYTAVLKLAPDHFKSYNNRGAAWFYKGDYERAIADYTKALEINPSYSEAYFNRGSAWFYKGDYNKAAVDYTKALEVNPSYSEAYFQRGEARFNQGDYYWAIADYSMALKIDPDYFKAYNQLSWTLAVCPQARFRNGTRAVELALTAVELNPDINSLDTLAAAYAEAGRFKDAVATQKKVIKLLKDKGRTKELPGYIERLKSYKNRNPWRERHIYYEAESIKSLKMETIQDVTANIRLKPATESLVVGKLKKGDRVQLIHRQGDWHVVKLADDRIGWIHQGFFLTKKSAVQPKNARPGRSKAPSVNGTSQRSKTTENKAVLQVPVGRVRQAPSLDAIIIFRLDKGTTVSVIEAKDNWYRIEHKDGRTGWAHQSLFGRHQ